MGESKRRPGPEMNLRGTFNLDEPQALVFFPDTPVSSVRGSEPNLFAFPNNYLANKLGEI